MSIDTNKLAQTEESYPSALEYYQFLRATSTSATYSGAYLDRFDRTIGSFSFSITTTAVGFPSIPEGAVSAIGRLTHPVLVNTGKSIDGSGITLTSATGWVEYPNDRLALGAVK